MAGGTLRLDRIYFLIFSQSVDSSGSGLDSSSAAGVLLLLLTLHERKPFPRLISLDPLLCLVLPPPWETSQLACTEKLRCQTLRVEFHSKHVK